MNRVNFIKIRHQYGSMYGSSRNELLNIRREPFEKGFNKEMEKIGSPPYRLKADEMVHGESALLFKRIRRMERGIEKVQSHSAVTNYYSSEIRLDNWAQPLHIMVITFHEDININQLQLTVEFEYLPYHRSNNVYMSRGVLYEQLRRFIIPQVMTFTESCFEHSLKEMKSMYKSDDPDYMEIRIYPTLTNLLEEIYKTNAIGLVNGSYKVSYEKIETPSDEPGWNFELKRIKDET